MNAIAWLCKPLLQMLFPAPGRRRAGQAPRVVGVVNASPRDTCSVDSPTVALACGADELVRPYMLTAEERRERGFRTAQRKRRRTLWLATYGIDVGPRRIHGVEVAG